MEIHIKLDCNVVQGADFENAVLHVAWALYKLKEAEAVQGLYVWCRDIVGCKILYLKALADHAAGRYVCIKFSMRNIAHLYCRDCQLNFYC